MSLTTDIDILENYKSIGWLKDVYMAHGLDFLS